MFRRLLVALPAAAVVVAGLVWVMNESLPFGQRGFRIKPCDGCIVEGWPQPQPKPPTVSDAASDDSPKSIYIRRPPPPQTVPPDTIEPEPMPRDRFPPPEPSRQEFINERNVMDHCERYGIRPLQFPKGARDGDWVIVEYTITPEGMVADVRAIDSSNPDIIDDVVGMVRRRRYEPPPGCKGQVKSKGETIRTRIQLDKE